MVADSSGDGDWAELLGAFAHELRTPLASANMVLQLSEMSGAEGELTLDAELSGMLKQSLTSLNDLAEQLQETSRLARGRLALDQGPCSLAAAIDAAREMAGPVSIECGAVPPVEGSWDATRLAGALGELVAAANRAGDNAGTVRVGIDATGPVRLELASGPDDAPPDPGEVSDAAALGFGFFHARETIRRMGGDVAADRREHACRVVIELPSLAG